MRAETTMTVGWIAERLAMGTRGYLNHLLVSSEEAGRGVANIKNCSRYDTHPGNPPHTIPVAA